jgi:hypothetical protein
VISRLDPERTPHASALTSELSVLIQPQLWLANIEVVQFV